MAPHLDLTSLKGACRQLDREQRHQLRLYLEALDAYEDSGEWAAEWGIVQACIKEVTGERWVGLNKLPKDLRASLESKLAAARALADEMHLTPAGRSRLWFIYLKGLADSGAPISPKTLAQWTTSMLAYLHQNLPYPRELQTRILNNGLR